MLWSDCRTASHYAAAALACLSLFLSACTVNPLYNEGGLATTGPVGQSLARIAVDPVNTRFAQEVRNNLIFLFNGGSGDPADPSHRLTIAVSKRTLSSATIQPQSAAEREPTASRIVMTAAYTLKETMTGKAVASGSRQAAASFDRPAQEFAILRAERDAEDRAARELAELLRLAVAQELLRK